MFTTALSSFVALASFSTTLVAAQVLSTYPATPLASKTFTYPSGIPYKVDTDKNLVRGEQAGYNICNSTTEGENSLCQTLLFNSIDDFCLWAPIKPNSTVGDIEGEMIAWCTKPGRGTRIIPQDALLGVQWMKTPDYVQVVGFIDQVKINLQADDWGGEMDPHGADLRGNPMGGLVYSNAYGTDANNFVQAMEWHNFIGAGFFCFKACDPSRPNDKRFCEHIYDRIGCAYNAPNNAVKGTFESCEGDNQDYPGIYTLNGATLTYHQPPESLGPINTVPYTARVPASSNCKEFKSAELYAAAAAAAAATSAITSVSGATGSATRGAPSASSTTNGATTLAVSGISILGVVFSTIFFS